MSGERILLSDLAAGQPLPARIYALFEQQRHSWPLLAENDAAFQRAPIKALLVDGARFVVQLNSGRHRSTTASVDAKSIAARPCFLCPENMPPEERGFLFDDFVVLPNPFPVLPQHCTVASSMHVPQRIADRIAALLRLTAALGPDYVTLYNGPHSGASAPDHFHFQCGHSEGLPILGLLETCGNTPITWTTSAGRSICIISGTDAEDVERCVECVVSSTPLTNADDAEPRINLTARYAQGEYQVAIFPRTAHRPARYFAEGERRIVVSPGAFEMCGLLIVADRESFDRLNEDAIQSIFSEVCAVPKNVADRSPQR
jgi:ATP adenylyltransferase/5',5'''-P-1,P-4-tetraphosphate phosphorylase II